MKTTATATAQIATRRAVTYLRCSGQGQVHGDTWRRQVDACESFARRSGLDIVRGFEDPAVSGTTEAIARAGFASMIGFCAAEDIDTIIVEDHSRLARDEQVSRAVRDLARARGLRIVSAATGEELTSTATPEVVFMQELQAAMAAMERRKIVAKLACARAVVRARDGRCEGRKPFGMKDGEDVIVREISALRAQGSTLASIAATLNARGMKPRTAERWTEATLCKIVRRIGVRRPTVSRIRSRARRAQIGA